MTQVVTINVNGRERKKEIEKNILGCSKDVPKAFCRCLSPSFVSLQNQGKVINASGASTFNSELYAWCHGVPIAEGNRTASVTQNKVPKYKLHNTNQVHAVALARVTLVSHSQTQTSSLVCIKDRASDSRVPRFLI